MYLKKLTMAGFKSFADPTEFHFHAGTTGVVGPNGCGKSNVVDAFRWVLGERSAKELRGQEMMDVIFKGTSSRQPVGRAEVSLLFENSDGALPIEFSEVEVTRRLFRSGESEYLINRRRCRLRDVRALLADTGIGTEGYSVLEQGAVDRFLHANPQQRREIFEEAAGISRYKRQTEQSLRQLERVEINLARLTDILREIERRVHSVKVQAGKARRYLEDKELLKRIRALLAAHSLEAFRSERETLTARLAGLEARREHLAELTGKAINQRDAARRGAESAMAALSEVREDETRLRVALERVAQRRKFAGERQAELQNGRRTRTVEREEMLSAVAEYSRRRAELRASLREEIASLRTLRTAFDAVDADRRARQVEKARLDLEIRTEREKALNLLFSETRLNNEKSSHEAEERGLIALAQRRRREADEFAREAQALDAALREVIDQRRRAAEELAGALSRQELIQTEMARRTQLLDEAERELAGIREQCQQDHARLLFLQGLEESREGIGKGARKLLETEHPIRGDILGLLSSCIETTPEIAIMVDAVLGAASEAVVFDGGTPQEDRARILPPLLGGDGVTFCEALPLAVEAAPPAAAGRPLLEMLSIEPRHRMLMGRVLGNVIVVEDVASAIRLQRENPGSTRYVTPAGWILEPWGAIIIPGNIDAGRGAGLVSRRSEMQRLRGELRAREQELERKAERASLLEHGIEAREAELRALREEKERRALEEENFGRRQGELQRDRARLADRERVVEQELAEIAASQARAAGALESTLARGAAIRAEREQLDGAVREKEERLAAAEAELAGLEAEGSQLRIQATQKSERVLALRREEMRIVGEIDERGVRERHLRELEGRESDRELALEREAQQLGEEQGRLEREQIALLARRDQGEAEVSRRREEREAAESLATSTRVEEDGLREEREKSLLRENELRVLIASLREKLAQEFELDLAAAPIDEWRGALALPEESEEALHARLAGEVESVQERVRKNANVNLEAVQELDELEGRQLHLAGQIQDLEQARGKLKGMIESLNHTCREKFRTTFEIVRKHYQELFTKVFNGGTSDLLLEEGPDVLEAGVEVIARPPGKRISSLKLLSGGEKALTAIAVLFALFRHRPSPFCLLDEVDAPLDESNTRRFIRILKEFTAQSQFIIITHSKVTMSEAEQLYGITMEERGVSTKVLVRLEEVNKILPKAPAVKREPPPELDLDAEHAAVEEALTLVELAPAGDLLSGDVLAGEVLAGDPLSGDLLTGDFLSGDPLGSQ